MTLVNEANLLNLATNVIPTVDADYEAFLRSEIDEYGQENPIYLDKEPIKCVIQPMPNSHYKEMGIDLSKNCRYILACINIRGLDTQKFSDRLYFEEKRWIVTQTIAWFEYNKWCSVIVVEDKQSQLGEPHND
jgi:hypothetical protein